ncbi:MAG: polyhydroxyalkanoic acid system family protein [Spirosoma sp.]|nr:polyhydroxyalkanoic acid system family protein [Spirosoma sp.]
MHIEYIHSTTKEKAVQKIDTFLDELMQWQFPGGIVIKEPTKNWLGDTMSFSFRVKKGFLGTTITGTVRVDDQLVVIDMDIPGIVLFFISEDRIREVINRQLDELFKVSA